MTIVKSSNLGYPRIGEKREWKKALEKYWNGSISEEQLKAETKVLRLQGLRKQQEKGIDLIPIGDFSLYDHVLDTSQLFNVLPKRVLTEECLSPLDTYFAAARGSKNAVASEMTKWFNTNYHYMVPEFNEVEPRVSENRLLELYNEAKNELGIEGKPVLVGPATFIKLGKGYDQEGFSALLKRFVPHYIQILKELQDAGVKWVQIDEPIFGTSLTDEEIELIHQVYNEINLAVPKLSIILQTYFETVSFYEDLVKFPVAAIGLDFVHGDNLAQLVQYGFPEDKVLVAGVIDGRNVWRSDLERKLVLLETIVVYVDKERLIIQPSCSLLHVPVTKNTEDELDPSLKGALSFADEKLDEVITLVNVLNGEANQSVNLVEESFRAVEDLNNSKYKQTRAQDSAIEGIKVNRASSFADRIKQQQQHLKLPLLPTTTIGSLPQTAEVRLQRLKWRKSEITSAQYEEYIQTEIKKWIEIQEDIGLDVLVHGEFERTDMVEYFGEKLNGFEVTKFGWVQSYGSRCVKPPLICGDVSFDKPMTSKESIYAQSLTEKKVKGMLTGPVTILNWSFVRDEIPRFEVLNQIAFAIREEIEDLERNGINVIQVDEPALREGLPLSRDNWDDYLGAAVYAFKLSTATVKNTTQIHTHMCYSDFKDIFEAISALDADVISIETSRSHGDLISTFEVNTYDKEIGLGVYDIHSPRIPSVEEIKTNIDRALKTIPASQFWINPDCGLKTRNESETIDALRIMVKAAHLAREERAVVVR